MTYFKILLALFSFSLLFHSSLASYNPTEAKEYAYASALAHCSPQSIKSWTCGAACTNLTGYKNFYSAVVNATLTQTFEFTMISNPTTKKFVTSYRGTVGNMQMLMEFLQGGSVPYNLSSIPGAQVNDYFYSNYVKYLRSTVLAQLKEAYKQFPDYKFIFTGHSLGAAIATINALDVIQSHIIPKEKIIMYNFGSPRVGNHIFAEAVENALPEIYRVTHWRDPIIHLPPCVVDLKGRCSTGKKSNFLRAILWPAYHLKQEIFYNEANTQYSTCIGGEDPKCADQFGLQDMKPDNHNYYVNVHIECDPNKKSLNKPKQVAW